MSPTKKDSRVVPKRLPSTRDGHAGRSGEGLRREVGRTFSVAGWETATMESPSSAWAAASAVSTRGGARPRSAHGPEDEHLGEPSRSSQEVRGPCTQRTREGKGGPGASRSRSSPARGEGPHPSGIPLDAGGRVVGERARAGRCGRRPSRRREGPNPREARAVGNSWSSRSSRRTRRPPAARPSTRRRCHPPGAPPPRVAEHLEDPAS